MFVYAVRALLANLRGRRALFALTVAGVAVGVASVFSIQLLNGSSIAAFRAGVNAISGTSDLSVVPRSGAIPNTIFPTVLGSPGVTTANPVVEYQAAMVDRNGFIRVTGVDLLNPSSPRLAPARDSVLDMFTTPGWAAVPPEFASTNGLSPGDSIRLAWGPDVVTLRIGATVDFKRISPLAPTRLAIMDIAAATDLFGGGDSISMIDVTVSPGSDVSVVARNLSDRLGSEYRVLTREERVQQSAGIMRAFRLNLNALSMLSLLVGIFLVHAATHASLTRRREEFGILRSLGATRLQVFLLIATEAGLLGVAGTALGLPLGYTAARLNLASVAGTITNLYVLAEIDAIRLSAGALLAAGATGLAGAALGSLLPALDMSRVATSRLLGPMKIEQDSGVRAAALFSGGILLLALLGAWYYLVGRDWQPAGFVLSVVLLSAIPLVAPALVVALARLTPPVGFGPAYSIHNLRSRLQTTSFAVSALAVAVAMLVGVTVMVGSFRQTVDAWAESVLGADIYVSPKSWRGTDDRATLNNVAGLASIDGVIGMDRTRGSLAQVAGRQAFVGGYELSQPMETGRFPLLDESRKDRILEDFVAGDALISEPLSRKLHLSVGDTVTIATNGETLSATVAGVYHDYSSEAGAIAVSMERFEELFGAGHPNTVALYLAPGADAGLVENAVRNSFESGVVHVRSNRTLRREALRIFDQTFAVTNLLRLMGLITAVAGIAISLLIMAGEQVPELALYRSLGALRGQLFKVYVGKGVAIGMVGAALGAAAGAVLSGILVNIVNPAFFGWTIGFHWPLATLGWQLLAIVAAALISAVYPAVRASKAPATELSHVDA